MHIAAICPVPLRWESERMSKAYQTLALASSLDAYDVQKYARNVDTYRCLRVSKPLLGGHLRACPEVE